MTIRNLTLSLTAVFLLTCASCTTNEQRKEDHLHEQEVQAQAFYTFRNNCNGYVFINHNGNQTGRERLLNLPGKGSTYYCIAR